MHEEVLMPEENDRKQFSDTLTRTSALVTALCASPLYFLFAYLGDSGRGRAAAICAFVVITAGRAFWDWRKRVWFWATLIIVVVLHVPLILLVSWSDTNYPGIVLLPLALVDFALVYGCFVLVKKVMKVSDVQSSSN